MEPIKEEDTPPSSANSIKDHNSPAGSLPDPLASPAASPVSSSAPSVLHPPPRGPTSTQSSPSSQEPPSQSKSSTQHSDPDLSQSAADSTTVSQLEKTWYHAFCDCLETGKSTAFYQTILLWKAHFRPLSLKTGGCLQMELHRCSLKFCWSHCYGLAGWFPEQTGTGVYTFIFTLMISKLNVVDCVCFFGFFAFIFVFFRNKKS